MELKVHPSFFREFATKTWISPYEIVRELIENAFDEDATNVLVTVLENGNVVIEDNAGMNSNSMDKFLILGSPHKAEEILSPKLKRLRTGRYGTGRLSFLTSFNQMKIKTRLDDFSKTITIDGNTLEELITGRAKLHEIREPKLSRNGTEILLIGSKISIDINKLSKEIKKLSILKYPLFEVYIKSANNIKEWDMSDSQVIRSPDIQGYKLEVNLDNPRTTGEITIARRPLGQDEKGIAIMVGNHVVLRSTFGFDNKLSRVTGYVKCDELTSRFADKSALIENDTYNTFNQNVKTFIIDQVLPSLTEYEDVLITREESKIYKEIDKVMGQAVLETLEPVEEIQGFESVEISSPADENGTDDSSHTKDSLLGNSYSIQGHENNKKDNVSFTLTQVDGNNDLDIDDENSKRNSDSNFDDLNAKKATKTSSSDNYIDNRDKILNNSEISNSANEFALNDSTNRESASLTQISNNNYNDNLATGNNGMIRKTVRKPILKKTFTLKKIG